jgi:hypothetical protein
MLAGRLSRGLSTVTVELSLSPPRLPPLGFEQDWGVQELNCGLPRPSGRPWAEGECEGLLAARDAFAAAYAKLFRATYAVGAGGVLRDGAPLSAEVHWRASADGSRAFEVQLPLGALPEVGQAPVSKADLAGFATGDGKDGARTEVKLSPSPPVAFEPLGATRATLFAAAASRVQAAPMSYRPGAGTKVHAVEVERGPEPRALTLREVDLVGPMFDFLGGQVASVYAGVRAIGMFEQGVLTDVLRDAEGGIIELANGIEPMRRGGVLHLPLWMVLAGSGGCPATALWVAELGGAATPAPRGAAKNFADPPPPAGTPGACWFSKDTWADASGDTFKSMEVRIDPATHRGAVRGVVWRYAPAANRYVRTVEAIAAP